MAEYLMKIYHDRSADTSGNIKNNIGHFYVELVSSNGDNKFFGQNPGLSGAPAWPGVVETKKESDRNSISKEHHGKNGKDLKFTTKEVPLTKEQYEGALKFAESRQANPLFYLGGGDFQGAQDCIGFAQEVYRAAGLPGDFGDLYSIANKLTYL